MRVADSVSEYELSQPINGAIMTWMTLRCLRDFEVNGEVGVISAET
jgi:hypothetical protein